LEKEHKRKNQKKKSGMKIRAQGTEQIRRNRKVTTKRGGHPRHNPLPKQRTHKTLGKGKKKDPPTGRGNPKLKKPKGRKERKRGGETSHPKWYNRSQFQKLATEQRKKVRKNGKRPQRVGETLRNNFRAWVTRGREKTPGLGKKKGENHAQRNLLLGD